MIVSDQIDVILPPFPQQEKALEHAYEMINYLVLDENNEMIRIKAVEYALAALMYGSKMTNCDIVLSLEGLRSSLLHIRKQDRDRLI